MLTLPKTKKKKNKEKKLKLTERKQIVCVHLDSKSKSWNPNLCELQVPMALLHNGLCYVLDSDVIAGKGIPL